jgi:hypothetical protein
MRKFLISFLIVLTVTTTFITISEFVNPHPAGACGITSLTDCALVIPGIIASGVILPLAGWITTLSGMLLNFVVNETVVHMANKLSNVCDANNVCGIGAVIETTWTTVRDVTNMLFIFALLYTAILTIFNQGNYKRTILNLIIAAILINFSLFFTKIIIDFGNLVALMFYHAIVGNPLPGDTAFDTGISNALMDQLHITSIWKEVGGLDGTKLVTIGIMGTIFALIAAFVFLAVSIMFVIRFVVLIFVLILSPLMFLGLILPDQSDVTKQWKNALLGQTFFAPIYFFLTWIVVQLGQGLYKTLGLTATDTTAAAISGTYVGGKFVGSVGTFGVLLNFVMMIAFLIMSLVLSKKYSDKSGALVSSATKWATGFAGGTTLGMAGRLGRGTIGRAGAALSDSEMLKKGSSSQNFAVSRLSRLSMAAGKKTSEQSFDIRGSGLGKTLGGGDAKKGGFAADNKKKIEKETKFAQSLAPSDIAKANVDAKVLEATNADMLDPTYVKQWNAEKAKRTETARKAQRDLASAQAKGADADTITRLRQNVRDSQAERDKIERMENYKTDQVKKAQDEADKLKGVDEQEARKRVQQARGWSDEQMKQNKDDPSVKAAIQAAQRKGVGALRQEAYAKDLETAWPISSDRVGFIGKIKRGNRQAALDIRKKLKEKKPAEKIAEEIEKQVQEANGAATPTPPPTPPPTPTP